MGASGMLGHKVYQTFTDTKHQVYGTLRGSIRDFEKYALFDPKGIIEGVDARIPQTVEKAFLIARPEIVINCLGLIKPRSKDPALTIEINALFPHKLAWYCDMIDARLVHISTDCVFSGKEGNYTEQSVPDPEDLYGRTKLLGEVMYAPHLTIRTSIIGRELGTKHNLVEWVLDQKGEVNGFVNAIFTGLTTRAFSRVLVPLLELGEVHPLLHVAGERVNKYDLLQTMNKHFGLNLTIHRDEDFSCDRSLVARPFQELGILVPSMEDMVDEMAAENRLYQHPTSMLIQVS
jgi:dTDP-4-dehydrorhamnose reductase